MLVWMRRGDELQHVGRRGEPVGGGLLAQDRDAGLQVGRLYVGQQAPLEPVAQPVLELGEPLRRPVGADHDLLVGVVQRVEGVEELLLGLLLALEELDVVDEEHVDVAVAALQGGGVRVLDRVDHVVGERLGGDVADLRAGPEVAHVVADGVQQVGLAESGVAVHQERVVGLARRLGDGDRGGVGEPVGGPDHEGLEGVARVQRAVRDAGGQRGAGSCRQIALATCLCVDSVAFVVAGCGPLLAGRLSLGVRRAVGGLTGEGTGARGGTRAARVHRVAGSVRAGRRLVGDLALQGGVHADGEADRLAEPLAEGVLDAGAQPALELVAGELVRYGDDSGALREHQRFAGGQPDPLVGRETVHDPRPEDLELACLVRTCVLSCIHAPLRSHSLAVPSRRPGSRGSTPLSTGCALFRRMSRFDVNRRRYLPVWSIVSALVAPEHRDALGIPADWPVRPVDDWGCPEPRTLTTCAPADQQLSTGYRGQNPQAAACRSRTRDTGPPGGPGGARKCWSAVVSAGGDGSATAGARRIDPVNGQRVPLAGRNRRRPVPHVHDSPGQSTGSLVRGAG